MTVFSQGFVALVAFGDLSLLFAFIGGLSASTAMVAVASIAVSTMILNNLIMPLAIRLKLEERLPPYLLNIKRGPGHHQGILGGKARRPEIGVE